MRPNDVANREQCVVTFGRNNAASALETRLLGNQRPTRAVVPGAIDLSGIFFCFVEVLTEDTA